MDDQIFSRSSHRMWTEIERILLKQRAKLTERERQAVTRQYEEAKEL